MSRWHSDYRNVVLRSEDDVVYVADDFPDRHVFQFRDHCIAPRIDLLLDGQGHDYTGFNILFNSTAHFDDDSGARNFDVGLACNQNSRVYADHCDFSGAGRRGAMVNNNSTAMLHNTDFSGAGNYGLRVSMSRVDAILADATDCGQNGLRVNQSGIVQARGIDVSGGDQYGMHLSMNASVSAEDATVHDCGNDGVLVNASTAWLRDADVSDSGNHGIQANRGANVYVSGSVTGSSAFDAYVRRGARVVLNAETSNGSPSSSDTNVGFNSVNAEGIIFSEDA